MLVYQKFIKGTQSEKLVKGIFILLFAWLFSEILIKFNLLILGVFLRTMVSVIMFGAVIIFQPEIRKFLGYLGQSNFFHAHFNKKNLKEEQKVNVIKELIESVKYLSKTRTGALMVLEREEDVNSYSDVGIQLDAVLSTELFIVWVIMGALIYASYGYKKNRKAEILAESKEIAGKDEITAGIK